MAQEKVAIVTGGNKGLGYAIVKGLSENFSGTVYLTARDVGRGEAAVKELSKEDATIPIPEIAESTVITNYFSLLDVCHELFPLLRPHARVVNMSSSSGSLTRIPGKNIQEKFLDPNLTEEKLSDLMRQFVELAKKGDHAKEGWGESAYVVSKVGVTALTFIQHKQFITDSREDIVVNCVHPGYVNTDMTSHKGPLSVEQGADAPLYLALLPPNVDTPKGEYVWTDRRIISWSSPYPK